MKKKARNNKQTETKTKTKKTDAVEATMDKIK